MTSQTTQLPPRPTTHLVRQGWTLTLVCTATFMLLLDVTVVSVALEPIRASFGASLSGLQWVVDAYTLPLAGLLLTTATLGDRLGRRRIFLTGMALFTAGSLLCAIATSSIMLDLVRAVQGAGGAMLLGTAIPMIGAAFTEPKARAAAIGIFGATLAAATAIGPLVGGILVDGLGWRWIFLINVPIGTIALVLGVRLLSESRASRPRRADWPGTAALTGALLALLFALIRGTALGWGSPLIVTLFVTSAVLLAAFIAREVTAAEPMVDLHLFARPSFAAVSLSGLMIGTTITAATSYLGIYMINTMGYTPLETGVRVLPLTIASFIASPITARLVDVVPPAVTIGGSMALVAIGMALCAGLDGASTWTALMPGFIVAGLGIGVGSASLSQAALGAVETDRAGMATGIVNTMRQLGTAAGVAILGVVFTNRATAAMTSGLAEAGMTPDGVSKLSDAVGSGLGARVAQAVPGPLREAVTHAATGATATAMNHVFLYGAVGAAATAVIAAALIRRERAEAR
ncbi:MFS transporter [Spelaeicoccus albus]|uniref:EmrB/QacA subfamily drug resistance transporter n=1 Tax=Spelaeicoccus albus TaxID=1280376 RepID=A0A7Z0D1N2_9MICO|nr:MFS transporter [Spelaeicoccus albus]NYI66400.1 EmrB/QacA subfamily drug resistance transporter [Spelaeicoccus albus]